jgi:hypothetical protein
MAALMAFLAAAASDDAHELRRGFSATHDPSNSHSQPVLADPTGTFALGFLRVNSSTMLDLAILHQPSSLPLWRATPAPWSGAATLSFDDAGLVLTDRAVLLNTSNLQIQNGSGGVAWQSFDHPSETIVQGQNFTSAAALRSFDRRFAMRLGTNYFALYIEPPSSRGGVAATMYFRHTAMEAKAQIVAGAAPTYARVEPDGFLDMYQKEAHPPTCSRLTPSTAACARSAA